ncbi:MAG TPA: hypothetical protein VHM19_11155, partial [Polyangiales bacterium]|nr:hypothetical protein [Polyangiales bacterium]
PPASHPKVDIVWVVDASGSMLDEQERITQNLANFAQSIAAANIDYHIVMITQAVGVPFICPSTGVDDPAPASLASDPNYRFVKHNVDSYNLLDVLVDHYDLYSSFLRADATLHFVTVSDDESTYHDLAPAAIRAAAFTKDMTALLGKPFFVDAIVSEGMENDTPCKPNPCVAPPTAGVCALDCGAANPGATYNALASDTHGVSASICAADWTQVFQSLSQAIVASAPLPCSYPIPPAPGGQTLDPAKVNVGYTQAGASAEEVLPHSNDAKACGDDIAWYYDQPSTPTQVLLCPKACAHVASGGTLAVTFGCKTFALD